MQIIFIMNNYTLKIMYPCQERVTYSFSVAFGKAFGVTMTDSLRFLMKHNAKISITADTETKITVVPITAYTTTRLSS